ncbi:hypothetical protein [Spiroplasma turonicum]|uniref:Uncharacterized protein n=1 Tax=Spiroplasma turonicum TaxID=216946 RepID=A0A0K1P727_9MOLU|nr:hypothetical protein [Spiroplasma turonicum]AKU80121.1 hypothetical protein STURON_00875 [Spiroplasma turonicum]ALX71121.1 hypothetical protein STURO_v1c08700 [Spiroplasma turonicum]
MANKTTLKDIAQISKVLEKKGYKSISEFKVYLDLIQSYIDETFFNNEAIIEKLVKYCENSSRHLDITFKNELKIDLSVDDIANYIKYSKKALEVSIFTEEGIFNHTIFVEIRSIIKYFLQKTYSLESLINFETLYGINTPEFHQQNETFKYLYTIFDKLTYIANHLKCKYLEKTKQSPETTLKFFTDFLKDISFLSKSPEDFEELTSIIDLITYSRAWHYIRRLRNLLEHDFADPNFNYNISFSINLLFIIIGRIVLALDKHLKTEKSMRQTLDSLRNS